MHSDLFLERIEGDAIRHGLIGTGIHIVAGISGGADSVCLLRVLLALKEKYSLSITAVHVNHMLRGDESDEDEKFTVGLCESFNVPVRVFHENIREISRITGISVEDAGRQSRYARMEQVLRDTGANVVAVAHNFEDQAETIMLNILRGCGLEGLTGMEWKSGHIIRPLLGTRRDRILDYLNAIGQDFRSDSSNLSDEYARNRVRNVIFPMLKEQFDADPAVMLNRLRGLARRDDSFLEGISSQEFARAHSLEGDGSIALDASLVASLHGAVASRVVRMAWEKLTGSRKRLENVHVDNMLGLMSGSATGKGITLPGGIAARMSYGKLIIGAKPERLKQYSYPAAVPGITTVPEAGGSLVARLMNRDEIIKEYKGKTCFGERSNTQIFDYLKINCGINIRNRRDGDRIRPLGSPGGRKLKEFFIDRKIRSDRRDSIPLVASGKNVLWVIGHRTSEDARPDESTETYLVLEWREGD
jgi:tRNA(Ile)-lysidine synthase